MTPYLIFPKIITHLQNETVQHKHNKPSHKGQNTDWLTQCAYTPTDGYSENKNIKQQNKMWCIILSTNITQFYRNHNVTINCGFYKTVLCLKTE